MWQVFSNGKQEKREKQKSAAEKDELLKVIDKQEIENEYLK